MKHMIYFLIFVVLLLDLTCVKGTDALTFKGNAFSGSTFRSLLDSQPSPIEDEATEDTPKAESKPVNVPPVDDEATNEDTSVIIQIEISKNILYCGIVLVTTVLITGLLLLTYVNYTKSSEKSGNMCSSKV
eukprot:279127_1